MEDIRLITEEEWKGIRNRLMYFAFKNFGQLHSQLGIDIETVVQDAIVDTLIGIRRWPPVDEFGNAKKIDLFSFLCGVIRSKAYHLIRAEAKKISIHNEPLPHDQEETASGAKDFFLNRLLAEQAQVDNLENGADRLAIYNQLCNKIRTLTADDELLTQMVELWCVTPDLQPRDIAILLGIPAEDVRKAQKRLDRRVKLLKKEWVNG